MGRAGICNVVCARKLLKGVSASQVNPWVTTPLPSPAAKAAPVVLPDPAPVWSPGGIDLEQMPLEVKSGLVKGSGLVLVGLMVVLVLLPGHD